jgi:hypothetical protein
VVVLLPAQIGALIRAIRSKPPYVECTVTVTLWVPALVLVLIVRPVTRARRSSVTTTSAGRRSVGMPALRAAAGDKDPRTRCAPPGAGETFVAVSPASTARSDAVGLAIGRGRWSLAQ